jgi:hypothetical protein
MHALTHVRRHTASSERERRSISGEGRYGNAAALLLVSSRLGGREKEGGSYVCVRVLGRGMEADGAGSGCCCCFVEKGAGVEVGRERDILGHGLECWDSVC